MSIIKRTDSLGEGQKLYENEDGFVIYRIIDEEYCEIDFIRIDKDMFRNGSGSKLLNEFKHNISKIENIMEFSLDAVVQNENIMSLDKLVAFYEKNGFKVSERFTMDEVERAIMFQEVKREKKKEIKESNKNNIK